MMSKSISIVIFIMLLAGTAHAYCSYYNPYKAGTGHHAGFAWAARHNVTTCGGNSQSFISGCYEFLRQKQNCQ